MNRSAARHLWTVLVLPMFSLGCVASQTRYSGDYEPHERQELDAQHEDDAPFVPAGLGDTTDSRPTIRKIAIAELGEASVPESAVKALRGSKKLRREVVVLPSVRFDKPPAPKLEQLITLTLVDIMLQAASQQATTQPATQPFDLVGALAAPPMGPDALRAAATRPSTRPATIRVDLETFNRAMKQYHEEVRAELRMQSAAEVARLVTEARKQQADALILLTNVQTAEQFTSTIFTWLDVLIVPIFVLPTETADGWAAGNGWLINPQTGRVIKTMTWNHRYRRYSPLAFRESNGERLWKDQREDAVEEVAKKLLD